MKKFDLGQMKWTPLIRFQQIGGVWSREDQTLRSYNLEGTPTIWTLFFKNRPIFGYFQFC